MGLPVDEIGAGEVMAVLTPIWRSNPVLAGRVRHRIGAVLKWAIANGHRMDNPVDAINEVLPKSNGQTKHHAALPHGDVAAAIAKVREADCWRPTKLAFEFIVLTAGRCAEITGATWAEIDLEAAVWTVPASRMKVKAEHRVPLSNRAVEVLGEARSLHDGDLVFPARKASQISSKEFERLRLQTGITATTHGFRSSFRDWSAEKSGASHQVMEQALAHTIPNKAEAAYARTDLLDQRRKLMQAWADYIAKCDLGDNRPERQHIIAN